MLQDFMQDVIGAIGNFFRQILVFSCAGIAIVALCAAAAYGLFMLVQSGSIDITSLSQ